MRKKILFFNFFTIIVLSSHASLDAKLIEGYNSDTNKYYSNLADKSVSIKQKLYTTLNSAHTYSEGASDTLGSECLEKNCYKHENLTYRGARQILFGIIDLQHDGEKDFIVEYYCNKRFDNNEFIYSYEIILGPDLIPNGRIINTEHTWPKSMFPVDEDENSELYDYMLSDLHHLIPTDSTINRDRHNYPFGEVNSGERRLKCTGPKLGRNKDFPTQTFFEPPNEIKGDIARGMMYFSVKYNTPIDDIQEQFLRKWDKQDPISTKEIFRNNIIHQYQGVRNPFIDFPNLAQEILDF